MTDAPQMSLSELFAIDPLTLTRDDPRIDQMTAALRAQRAQFKLSEAEGRRPARQPKSTDGPKGPKPKVSAEAIKDLELDL